MTETTPDTSQDDGTEFAEFQAFQAWRARHGASVPASADPTPVPVFPEPTPVLNPAANQPDPGVERGQLETAIRSGQIDPTLLESLLARLNDLEKQVENQKNQAADPDAPEGGTPVPHHLHLADGTVVTDHPGVATHYAGPDGIVKRVVTAYPVTPSNPV